MKSSQDHSSSASKELSKLHADHANEIETLQHQLRLQDSQHASKIDDLKLTFKNESSKTATQHVSEL